MSGGTANTSATGGPLIATTPAPDDDLELDTIIQGIVAGLTGLPSDLVRPRWQDIDPSEGGALPRVPDVNTTWVAVGVVSSTPDDTPAQIHHPDGDGYQILRQFERLEVLASFYGPKSNRYASAVRDGFYIAQNREVLLPLGLGFIDTDPIRRVPEIMVTQTRRRSDLTFRLTRRIERRFAILNVLKGVGTIRADYGIEEPKIEDLPFQAPET